MLSVRSLTLFSDSLLVDLENRLSITCTDFFLSLLFFGIQLCDQYKLLTRLWTLTDTTMVGIPIGLGFFGSDLFS